MAVAYRRTPSGFERSVVEGAGETAPPAIGVTLALDDVCDGAGV